jgi:hypothetical protein
MVNASQYETVKVNAFFIRQFQVRLVNLIESIKNKIFRLNQRNVLAVNTSKPHFFVSISD